MKKLYKIIIMLGVIIVFPGILQGQAAIDEVVLEERLIDDPLKSWSITFTQPIDKESLNKENIFLRDGEQEIVDTTLGLSEDERTVTIKPNSPYEKGEKYFLYINGNLKSGSNVSLKEDTVLPFQMKEDVEDGILPKGEKTDEGTSSDSKQTSSSNEKKPKAQPSSSSKNKTNGTYLVKVQMKAHTHFTEINVQVSDRVAKVKAGRYEFEYKGNNRFVLYYPGLESGDKLTIKAFTTSNRTLESKEVVTP